MNKNVVTEIDLGSQSGSRTSFATTYYSNKLFAQANGRKRNTGLEWRYTIDTYNFTTE